MIVGGIRLVAFILCITLLTVSPLPAQKISIDRITPESGISQQQVQSIVQDRDGFMWFSTLDGLNRFDGYQAKVFKHIAGDSTSLPRNDITALCVDRNGTLWAGTNGSGLCRYDRTREKFSTYRHSASDPSSLGGDLIRALYVDREGTLWIGTAYDGLDEFREGRFMHHRRDPGDTLAVGDNTIWTITGDHEGKIWIGTSSGVDRIGVAGGQFRSVEKILGGNDPPVYHLTRTCCEDPEYQVWLGGSFGFRRWDSAAHALREFRLTPPGNFSTEFLVFSILADRQGNLWVGTNQGLARIRRSTGSVEWYQHERFLSGGLSDNVIISLYEDASGTIWCGTYSGGVDKITLSTKKFDLYSTDPRSPYKLSSNAVFPVREDRGGEVWVGTGDAGVDIIDRRSGYVKNLRHDAARPRSLCDNSLRAILEDRNGRIWLGTDNGLDVADPATGQIEHFNLSGARREVTGGKILSLLEDPKGMIWIGTDQDGLRVYDPEARSVHSFAATPGDPRALSGNRILSLAVDRRGVIWIGTDGGLNSFDPAGSPAAGTFDAYAEDPSLPGGLPNNTVMAIVPDSLGNIWIGRYGGGICMLDSSRRKFTTYTEADGLASDGVVGIVDDHAGNLWISTTNGLSRFSTANRKFRTYTASDGLQGNEFNFHSFYRSPSGEMFFGGNGGLTSFFPDRIRDNPFAPPVVLTGFTVLDRSYSLPQSISTIAHITLSYSEDYFSFVFAALEYTSPGKNRYAYRLEGYDPAWSASSERRFASYRHIEPGDYTFRVRASNNDDVWNETGASVGITITPPFWATLWFRSLVVLAIAGILTLLYQYRIRRLLEMERLRFRIATDLHDDIGSNLGSIALVTDMVKERFAENDAEHRQLDQASRAARQMTDAMRDIVWFINPDHDRLDHLVTRMKDVASTMLAGIDYSFYHDEHIPTAKMPMEFKRNLFLIFKESLHNIVRHARATQVSIRIEEHEGTLTLMVRDNGSGFDLAAASSGSGLKSLRSRAHQIHGELMILPDGGTTVLLRVRLP